MQQKTEMAFEETELRLGLGLGLPLGSISAQATALRKRGFSETKTRDHDAADDEDHEDDQEEESGSSTVDLMLNLSPKPKEGSGTDPKEIPLLASHPAMPPAPKAQVVGWPPVRSFRKNMFAAQKSNGEMESEKNSPNASFVKVSMDGAPYLRKVDLKMYKSYPELSDALGKMFSSFTIGNCESQGFKDFMNESKLMDLLNSSDYVPTYEDKDGDWMLVGDVPWEMFVESCKRLRIMKGKEAIGLAPRAMEKCKNRS